MAVSARGETVEHKEHELRGAFDHKEASRTAQTPLQGESFVSAGALRDWILLQMCCGAL